MSIRSLNCLYMFVHTYIHADTNAQSYIVLFRKFFFIYHPLALETLVYQRSDVRFMYRGANYEEVAVRADCAIVETSFRRRPYPLATRHPYANYRLCSPIKLSRLLELNYRRNLRNELHRTKRWTKEGTCSFAGTLELARENNDTEAKAR